MGIMLLHPLLWELKEKVNRLYFLLSLLSLPSVLFLKLCLIVYLIFHLPLRFLELMKTDFRAMLCLIDSQILYYYYGGVIKSMILPKDGIMDNDLIKAQQRPSTISILVWSNPSYFLNHHQK